MKEALDDAKDELKRVDHQIYVSLKYTRTVDVLINIINRMIEAYDQLLMCLLRYAKEKNLIEEIPKSPREKGDTVKRIFEAEQVRDNVDLYFLLRKISRSAHTRENEYRRHVTLRTIIDGREEIVNIDVISQYYMFMREFYNYTEGLIGEKND